MSDMLALLVLAAMVLVIAVLVILIIYLIDRFNRLESDTRQLILNLEKTQAETKPSGPYAGLSGKALWDTLCGLEPTQIDEDTLEAVRKRYRLLLGDHISFVFKVGVTDSQRSIDSPPAESRQIRTPRGQVESWLPPESVAAIYRCGQDYASNKDPQAVPELRLRLNAVSASLYAQCGLDASDLAAASLMPDLPSPGAGDPAGSAPSAPA